MGRSLWKPAVRRRRVVALPVTAFLLAALLAGAGNAPSADAGSSAPRDHVGKQPLSFGLFVPGQPEQGLDKVRELERRLGRRASIVLWYQHWGSPYSRPFSRRWLETAVEGGRTPVITWEPWRPGAGVDQPEFRLRAIAAGRYDEYIRSWARELAAWGRVVYLRPMHEMNGTWYPWAGTVNGNSAGAYVDAWRRMHRLFRAEGARNVKWVWCVNARSWPNTRANQFERYYPGERFVDVLAVDGYNRGGSTSRSFDEIFRGTYARLARLGRQPIWVTETASHTEGVQKADWIKAMFAAAQSPRYRRLAALVWFSAEKKYDYRADSSPEVAAAFAEARVAGRSSQP